MRSRLAILVLAVALGVALLAAPYASATVGVARRQLSGFADDDLKTVGAKYVSGDRVVWASGPQVDDALMVLDFGEATASVVMTSPYAEDIIPSVSGDLVAALQMATWSSKGDIYLLDLASGAKRKITPERGYYGAPSVSGSWVAWTRGMGSRYYSAPSDIVAYRVSDGATFTIPAEMGPSQALSLDGDLLAWQEGPSVVVYDLSQRAEVFRSSDATPAAGAPTVADGWVAWPSGAGGFYGYYRSTQAAVRAHEIATGRDVRVDVPMMLGDSVPAVRLANGRAYWSQYSSTGTRIMSSVLGTSVAGAPSVALTLSRDSWLPGFDVSGDHIVWQQYGPYSRQLWGTYRAEIPRLTIRASRTTVPYGGTVRLTGTTTLPTGTKVWLERQTYSYSDQWGRVKAVTVSGGRLATDLTVSRNLLYRFTFPGTPTTGTASSSGVRLMPYAKMSAPAPTAPAVTGKKCSLIGSVKPTLYPYESAAYINLEIQRLSSGRWVRVVAARATRSSRIVRGSQTYRGAFTPSRRGSYRVRAVAPTNRVHARTVTAWKTFAVR